MALFFIGIDPGSTGGVVVINAAGEILRLERFDRADPSKIITAVVAEFGSQLKCGLEAVHAMPGQGVSSMFTFGEGYGKLQGALDVLGVPYTKVAPQTWQKILPWAEDPKQRAVAFCRQTYGLDRFILPRCRRPHSGMIDATCIAEWVRRIHFGLVEAPKVRVKPIKRQPIKILDLN